MQIFISHDAMAPCYKVRFQNHFAWPVHYGLKTLSFRASWLETWKFYLNLFKALFLISLYIETNIANLLVLKIQGLSHSALDPFSDFELKGRGKMNWRNDLCFLYWQNTHCSDAVLFSITHNVLKKVQRQIEMYEKIFAWKIEISLAPHA